MTKFHLLALILLFSFPAYAQELVPATSEDIQEFDRQISAQAVKTKAPEVAKDPNFGSVVREETKRIKENGESKEGFGKWVSSQRRKNTDGRPAASGNGRGGSAGGGNKGSLPTPADKNKGKRGH